MEIKEISKFTQDTHWQAQLYARAQHIQGFNARSTLSEYQKSFNLNELQHVAKDYIDFFKVFDDWHPGLN